MIVQTRTLIISAKGRNYTFRVRIHKAESPAEQLIEADFYKKFANTVHVGTHHEIELAESPVWGRRNPDVPIHIHQNKDTELYFVCFTGKVETLDAALAVLRTWCLGTVYAMMYNEDFMDVVRKVRQDSFAGLMNLKGIVISGDFEV